MLKTRWAVDASFGERQASTEFERIFAQHAGFACRVLRRFGVSERDLADASQDVFIVVHRRLPEFEARAALQTWVYRICVRVAADYRKRAHRRYELLGETLPRVPAAHVEDDPVDGRQLARQLALALERLEPEKRAAFVLYELQELSMSEVAARLGCPLKTAFSRLYAARSQLRKDLRRAGYAAIPLWLVLVPFAKARAASGLRAALETLATGAIGGAQPALAGLPAAAAGGTGAMLLKTGAASCSACALTLISLVLPPATAPSVGPVLVQAAQAAPERASADGRVIGYRIARSISAPPSVAPVPEPPRPRRARIATERTPAAPVAALASAAAAAPAPQAASGDWVRAPRPAPQPARSAPLRPAPDLQEVLAATSIRSQLRFGPADRDPQRTWVLVPHRPIEHRSDRSRAGGSTPARRASTRR
jgi:RNA polymerase sigma-70 factor (ECF subfamily)